MPTTEQKIAALQQAVITYSEYATITPLFVGIYEYVSCREDKTGIMVDLSGIKRCERSGNGFPLISPAEMSGVRGWRN
jgi:FdhE protein